MANLKVVKKDDSKSKPTDTDVASDQETLLLSIAVGRAVRAVTYPVIGNDYADMSLRELNALATLSHVNHELDVCGEPSPGSIALVDTFDAMMMAPGAGQAFFAEEHFLNAVENLAARGLVEIVLTNGNCIFPPKSSRPTSLVILTPAGRDLIDAIGGNIGKSLSLLNDSQTQKVLKEFGGAQR